MTARPDALRICGRESPGSQFDHALVARCQTHLSFPAETALDMAPRDCEHFAGLIAWYGRFKFHYLAVTGVRAEVQVTAGGAHLQC